MEGVLDFTLVCSEYQDILEQTAGPEQSPGPSCQPHVVYKHGPYSLLAHPWGGWRRLFDSEVLLEAPFVHTVLFLILLSLTAST